jgi:hypothetical protein
VPFGEFAQLIVVAEEHVQAVLDVQSVRDAALQQVDPRRRESPTLGRDADECGVRVETKRVVTGRAGRSGSRRRAARRPAVEEDRSCRSLPEPRR